MCKDKKETVGAWIAQLQTYLNEAFYHKARIADGESGDFCNCPNFADIKDCEHICDLEVHKELYQKQATAWGQLYYTVIPEAIYMRVISPPHTTSEKIMKYDTSLSACNCQDWQQRGGSYLYEANGRYFTQCKHQAWVRSSLSPANPFIGQSAPKPPFVARSIPYAEVA